MTPLFPHLKNIDTSINLADTGIDGPIDSQGRTLLLKLICDDAPYADIEKVLQTANPNIRDFSYYAPLHYAAKAKRPDIVALLIAKGANVEPKNDMDQSPLYNALESNCRESASLLLAAGAQVRKCLPNDSRQQPPAFLPVLHDDADMLRMLQEHFPPALSRRNKDGMTLLHYAASTKSNSVFTYLMSIGASPLAKDGKHLTPLHQALQSDNIPAALHLLSNPDVCAALNDMRDHEGLLPLHYAARAGHVAAAEALISAGALTQLRDAKKKTPFHHAVAQGRDDMVAYLKSCGVTPSKEPLDEDGNSLLHTAARQGRPAIARTLLDEGATSDNKNNDGKTPLLLAMETSTPDVDLVAALLAAGAKPDTTDKTGHRALEHAIKKTDAQRRFNLVSMLLKAGTHPDPATPPEGISRLSRPTPALNHAVRTGYRAEYALLIAAGASLECINPSRKDTTPLLDAAECTRLEMIRDLINRGANIDARDGYNRSVLHLAARANDRDSLAFLIEKAPHLIDAQDNHNRTPLNSACRKNMPLNIEKLVKAGADAGIVDHVGWTPVHHIALRGDGALDCLNAIADAKNVFINARANEENTALHMAAQRGHNKLVERLLEMGADPRLVNESLDNSAHVAAREGQMTCLKAILSTALVDVNRPGKDARTLLHHAANRGHADIFALLADCNCNINALDAQNATPLHLAASAGQTDMCVALIKSGANIALTDVNGQTPLAIAQAKGHDALVEILSRAARKIPPHARPSSHR